MKIQIVEKTENEVSIDWGKKGQIMVSKETGNYFITTGWHEETIFSAFCINTSAFYNSLKKELFTTLPTNQQIILSNE
jgi:hypothetical protein